MACDISTLPREVMIHVFEFLDVGDRLKASQVCKKWLKTIDCPELLCDVKVQFSRSREVDEAVKRFFHMTRRFQWFSFCKIVIGNSVIELLEKYSNQLVILSFIDCTVDEGNSQSKFKDYVISELTKCLSKLERLLLYNTVSFEVEAYKRFYVDEEALENNPSDKVFTFSSIKLLIEKNRTTLRHVDFTFLRFSAEAVLSISEIEGLKLRSVLFPRNFLSSSIPKFCEMQSSLIYLNLSSVLHGTDSTVCDVCKLLHNLKELIIKKNPTIDRCICEIFQLQNLLKLDVSGSMNISESSYQEAVANLKTFKLKYLDLHFAKISDDSLFKLLKCNQNIRYLDASGIRVSNKTLNMICQTLTLLKCLILEPCPTISDSGLTGEFENYSDSIAPTPLSNLKYLKVLILSSNSLITNQGCIKAIRFRKLVNLSLTACRGLILNDDFEIELKKQNPCLRNFRKSN
ncbi:f-box domain-containing protein [Trichonephila inaurata madagascariensis]|uniref:F-box domain-containing protein n=1 Tax=Trichonephila inaurata madagascariensis TaxID=2747483 RepID=A0A8X6JLG2_9ARAC|nr:f-box domain-containing protein [Trichonephila inaurata madagascariensis]